MSNDVFDYYMKDMTGSEFKVLMAICRKTIGWHKDTDAISISQIEKMTGLSNVKIIAAIKSLESRELIAVDRKRGETSHYTINYTSEESSQVPVKKVNGTSEESSQVPVKKVNTQKKDKETLQKKDPCDQAVTLANAFYDSMKAKVNPPIYRYRKPDLNKWALDIERLNITDGQPWIEIERVIRTVFDNEFWSDKILSGAKLREKYNTLYLQMQKNGKPKTVRELYGEPYVHNKATGGL